MLSLEPHLDVTLLRSTFLLVICTLPWAGSLEVTPLLSGDEDTFPPPGWCLMLSVDPILERALRMSGAVVVRVVALREVVDVVAVVEVGRGVRGAAGFFSPADEEGTLGLVAVGRGRAVVVLEVVEVVRAVLSLGLVESVEVFRALAFFSSPGLASVFEARGLLAVVAVVVRVVVVVVRVVVPLLPGAAVPFLAADVGSAFGTGVRFSVTVFALTSRVAAVVVVVRLVVALRGRLGAAAAVLRGLVLGGLAAAVAEVGLAAVGALAVGAFLSVAKAEEEEGVGLLVRAEPVGGAVEEAGRVLAVVLGLTVEVGFALARSLPSAALLPLATGLAFLALSAGSALAFFSSFFSAVALLGASSFTFSGSFTGSSSAFFTSSILAASTLASGSAFFSAGSTLGSLTEVM